MNSITDDGPDAATAPKVAVLCGGVGAARLLTGLRRVIEPSHLTAIVNTADDAVLNGLSISPDLDTVVYTTAEAIDPERGWGLAGETWRAMEALGRYEAVRPPGSNAATTWFNLGDADLATHLYRTTRLAEGATLTEVTAEIATAWGIGFAVLPMTDDRIATRLTVVIDGISEEVSFQDYFVRLRHNVDTTAVRFVSDAATPTAQTMAALEDADVIVIAPSNPVVSIGPIRSLPGIDELLHRRRADVVAVSPIIGGAALKGPADRLMASLGAEPSVVGVAEWYEQVAAYLVIDPVDAGAVDQIVATGMTPVVQPSIMSEPAVTDALALATIKAPSSP